MADTRNIKLTLEYDGTDFYGWQIQPDVRTVQAEVDRALSELTQESIRTTVAGRTDTGVHALGQVVNFKTTSGLSLEAFCRGGNAILPRDVRILAAEVVPENFNARFSASARHYRYVISKRPKAVGRQYSWYVPYGIDVVRMAGVCSLLLGEHDFRAFCQSGADVAHYRCIVYQVDWSEDVEHVYFNIRANRFLHNMVRILVGTFMQIGSGKMDAAQFQQVLSSRDRRQAGPTAPPHGLFLVHIDYEDQ